MTSAGKGQQWGAAEKKKMCTVIRGNYFNWSYDVTGTTWHKILAGNGVWGGADKSLARPGRKQATATEDFKFHISYL